MVWVNRLCGGTFLPNVAKAERSTEGEIQPPCAAPSHKPNSLKLLVRLEMDYYNRRCLARLAAGRRKVSRTFGQKNTIAVPVPRGS